MKKRTVVLSAFPVFVLMMFSAVTAEPQSPAASQDNGSSWKVMSGDARLWFVVGYNKGATDGIEVAYHTGFEDGIQFAASAKSGVDGRAVPPQTAMDKLRLHSTGRTAGSRHPSHGEVVAEMTLFYEDFRNTPVCWGAAAQIAQVVLMGGAPSEADLDAVRSEDAKDGCQ